MLETKEYRERVKPMEGIEVKIMVEYISLRTKKKSHFRANACTSVDVTDFGCRIKLLSENGCVLTRLSTTNYAVMKQRIFWAKKIYFDSLEVLQVHSVCKS